VEKKKKIKERARKRQSTLNNQETAPAHLSVSEQQQQDIGETREIVSKKVGISRGTYDYSSFISFNGL